MSNTAPTTPPGARVVGEKENFLLLVAQLPEGEPLRRTSRDGDSQRVYVWDDTQISGERLIAVLEDVRAEPMPTSEH